MRIQGLALSRRPLVDPTALYPRVNRTRLINRTHAELVWLLAATEADEEWNRRPDQPYYNALYRASQRVSLASVVPPAPAPSRSAPARPRRRSWFGWLRRRFKWVG